jgi:hypothetical protein
MPIDLALDPYAKPQGTASAFVKNSRSSQVENAKKEAEKRQKQQEDEEEEQMEQRYSSADLKGLKIMHSEKNLFKSSENVILTLADADVLERDEYGNIIGIREEDDLLENVNAADYERKAERDRTIKRSQQPIYNATDDTEFHNGVATGKRGSLLAQYDKPEDQRAHMEIGSDGQLGVTEERKREAAEANANKREGRTSLEKTGLKEINDFYTKDEYKKLTKFGSKGSGKEKKKRNLRKKRPAEEMEGAEEEVFTVFS